MANAVLATPEAPFESRGLDKKQTWWERLRKGDEVAHLVTLAGGWSILVITALLVQHLWVFSRLSRHAFGWHFLVDSTWDPVNGHFGAWPFVYGTVVTSLLALAISIPIGIGSAIFLAELAPRKTLQWAHLPDRTAGGGSQRHLRTDRHLPADSVPVQRGALLPEILRLDSQFLTAPSMASVISPPRSCFRSWWCRSSFPFPAKSSSPFRCRSAKP